LTFLALVKEEGDFKIRINFVEIARSILIPLIVAAVTVLITLKVMQNDLDHYSKDVMQIQVHVEDMCKTMNSMNERLTRAETRQQERIEHEINQGLRRLR